MALLGRGPEVTAAPLGGERSPPVVLTDGPRGSVAMTSTDEVSVQAVPVNVIDTVGAGDSFTVALLSYLHEPGDLVGAATLPARRLREALEFANLAAAILRSNPGQSPSAIQRHW